MMFGALLVLCAGPILTVFPVNIHFLGLTQQEKEQAFKVMTYNVLNFKDNEGVQQSQGNRTLAYILETDADIVCLQEAPALHTLHPNGIVKAQLDSIFSRYPHYVEQTAKAGETILSKYPLKVLDTPQPDWGSGHYTAYEVDIEGHPTTVVNCHLQSIGLTDNDKELYKELSLIHI